jgi:uncharacterized protein (TIRG00374 family)
LNRTLLKALRFFLFLAIGLFLLYLAVREVSIEEFVSTLKKANFGWVALALFFALIGYLSRAYRWKLLIKPLNYDPPFRNVFYALMLGYTANFALPRLGEVTRCGSLRKSDQIPLDSLLGTVIIERAIDLLVLLTITVIIFFSKIGFFGAFFRRELFQPMLSRAEGLLAYPGFYWVILVLFMSGVFLLLRILFRRFTDNPAVIKVKKLLRGVISGLKTIAHMKNRWAFIFHTVIIWLMYFLMTYVLVFALPATSHLAPIDGLFLLVIGGLGMSAPVQGGLGVFHVITMAGLSLYGVSRSEGFAYAVLSHESQSLFAILLGALSFILLMIENRRALKKSKL